MLIDVKCDFCDLTPGVCSPQGKEIIEYYLRELEQEGVTHVPRWTPSPAPKSASATAAPALTAPLLASRPISIPGPKDGAPSSGSSPPELPPASPDGRWSRLALACCCLTSHLGTRMLGCYYGFDKGHRSVR